MIYNGTSNAVKIPTAFITKGKQRVKQYSQNVYLKDGDEFEIELFNPTQHPILAKIKINGNYISTSGVIIRPGQRIFLERFIDVNKKLLYSTYEVDRTDTEVKNAIKYNGNVEIEFHTESTPNTGAILTNMVGIGYSNSSSGTGIVGGAFSGNNITTTYTPYTTNYDTLISTTTTDLNTITNLYNKPVNHYIPSGGGETGRIDTGDMANQYMYHTDVLSFNTKVYHIINWKILPNSHKPIEVSDLKKYCHNCGSIIKKSTYKFCPNCGVKLD